jgi:hypothetical protein
MKGLPWRSWLKRQQLPAWAGMGVGALGVAHILIVCLGQGWKSGLVHVSNDPGKVLFHLALLPAAVWVLLKLLPLTVIRKALSSQPIVAWGWGLFLLVVAGLLAGSEARDKVCFGMVPPYAIETELGACAQLKDAYRDIREVHNRVWGNKKFYDVWLRLDSSCSKTQDCRYLSAEAEVPQQKQQWFECARHCYGDLLDDCRRSAQPATVALAQAADEVDCHYGAVASWRSLWDALLSFVGAGSVLAVFWIMTLHALTHTKLSDKTFTALIMVALLIAPWMPLRVYSEWYLNFGSFDVSKYQLLIVALVFSVPAAFLIFVLRTERSRSVLKALTGIWVLLTGVGGVVAAMRPELLDAVAGNLYVTKPLYQFFCYASFVAVLFWTGYYIAGEDHGPD